MWAPSDCSAQVFTFTHLSTVCCRSNSWQDLCRESVVSTRSTSSNADAEPLEQSHHRDTQSRIRGSSRRTSSGRQQPVASLFDQCVSDLIAPTLAHLSCPVPRFHASPTDSWWCQTFWRNDQDSRALLHMEERHSNVVSGNQTSRVVPSH